MCDFTKDEIYILSFLRYNTDWSWDYVCNGFVDSIIQNNNHFPNPNKSYTDTSTVRHIIFRLHAEEYIKVINDKVQVTQKGIDLCNKFYSKNS